MTPATILALLRADPALAVKVDRGLRRLHIAGPWDEGPAGIWLRRWVGVTRSVAASVAAQAFHSPANLDLNRPVVWTVQGNRPEGWGRAETIEEAKAAADAALVAAGWVLAPPEPEAERQCLSERAGVRCGRSEGHSGPHMGPGRAWQSDVKPEAP